jgi:hypothetical protein
MKTGYLLIISAAAVGLSSCSTSLYVSNNVNVPLMREKGEVKVNVDQSNLQVAYAVSDHWGVMVNGFSRSYQGKEYFDHSGRLIEAGGGYFLPLRENVIFEAYAGGGMGKVDKKVTYTNAENRVITNTFNATGAKAFIQPSIGYGNKYFDIAFTPRFSYVKYLKFNSSGFSSEELAVDNLHQERLLKADHLFAEPALTLRAGYKFFKLQLQYGKTMNIGKSDIRYCPDFGSIGFVIDVAKWYSPKKKR